MVQDRPVRREVLRFDVLIIGAGPAGLSAAIRLRQLCLKHGHELSVCIIEKGSAVGAHILSGAVFDPIALNELIPDWKGRGAPLYTPVSQDEFFILTPRRLEFLKQCPLFRSLTDCRHSVT